MSTFYLSKPVNQDMETWLRDTINFTFDLKDEAGEPVDMTDWTAVYECYNGTYDKNIFNISGEVIESGAKMKILKEDFSGIKDGTYSYRIVVTSDAGTYTVSYGELKIR